MLVEFEFQIRNFFGLSVLKLAHMKTCLLPLFEGDDILIMENLGFDLGEHGKLYYWISLSSVYVNK